MIHACMITFHDRSSVPKKYIFVLCSLHVEFITSFTGTRGVVGRLYGP